MIECQKCKTQFPYWCYVDGVRVSLNGRSYCLTCSPHKGDKNKQNTRLNKYRNHHGRKQKWCKYNNHWVSINEFGVQIQSGKSMLQSYCRVCKNLAGVLRVQKTKQQAVDYKGNQCYDCKGKFANYIYDFHHLNKSNKDADFQFNRSWIRVKKELDKCVMLCSHCHRHRHHDPQNRHYMEKD